MKTCTCICHNSTDASIWPGLTILATLLAAAALFISRGEAQQSFMPYPTQTLRFETPPPLLPTNVRANYSGAFGANTFVYWVIAQHTRGPAMALRQSGDSCGNVESLRRNDG